MVDNKSRDNSSIIGSSSATHIYLIQQEKILGAVDQISNVQPQYSQALSNLQLDYIQATKNLIQNKISAQKQFLGSWNVPVSTSYTEQFTRQSNEITNNTLKVVDINNQLAINALDLARENLKVYSRAADAVTEFSNNIAKACTVFSGPEQRQQQQQSYHSLEKGQIGRFFNLKHTNLQKPVTPNSGSFGTGGPLQHHMRRHIQTSFNSIIISS